MKIRPKRLLITGGTGHLGGVLAQYAQNQGVVVAASYYSNPPPNHAHPDIFWLPLDICDQQAVEEGIDMVQPDVIIHTAYRQQEPNLWQVTAQGSHHIALAAQKTGSRLIHLSSDVIFDGNSQRAYVEQDCPKPITSYGKAKADAEAFVAQTCTNMVIVRTSLIYDYPKQDRHTQFVLEVADGLRTATLFQDEYRCPIFVHDLAKALLELGDHPYCGYLNIAGKDILSRYEFGVLLAKAHQRDPSTIHYGLSRESNQPRPRNCALDIRLAQSLLHTHLRGVHEILTPVL